MIMGLNPPFGLNAILANKFIDKALTFKPKLIILIVPKETERLDRKRQPYDLVWEDNQSLSGKSFYLPGSLDASDKQMDQWNVFPPPLYLWSRPDWTAKHNNIAEKYGHTEILKVVSHANEEVDHPFDDYPTQNHAEVTYERNSTSGKEKGTCMDKNLNFVVGKQEQVYGFPPEKQVEVAYEETMVASNRNNTCQADQSGVHNEERYAHSELRIGRHSDGRRAIEISNRSGRRRLSEKTGEGNDAKVDSGMSISPSVTRNAQYESSSLFHPMPCESEHPSVMQRQNNYLNHPVPEPCTSFIQRAPYEDSYFRNVNEYGIASLENHFSFSTENMSPGLEEQQSKLYTGDPACNLYSSTSGGLGGHFYGSQDFEDRQMDCTMESAVCDKRNLVPVRGVHENARTHNRHIRDDNPQTAMDPPATDIRAQIRMYGGHVRDDHPQTAMNSPGLDIRAQIRMYGGQSTYDHPHTGRHYSGSSDSRFQQSALTPPSYGMLSLDSTDHYNRHLDEANYTPGPRVPYSAPDPLSFASHHQYPYPRPGSSGGWLG